MRNILILGGSSDIGISVAEIFLKKNWRVFTHYNTQNKSLEKLKYFQKKIKFLKCDFNKDKDIKKFVKNIKKLKISSCVNLIGHIDNISYETFNINNLLKTIKINAAVPLYIQKNLLGFMKKNSFGRILNISSIGVKYGGGKNTFNYSISKHILEFIPSFSKNLAQNNILINNLRVGVTDTKIHKKIKSKNLRKRISLIPLKRMASRVEIAKFIYQLSSDENTYLTNETISISGGE